MIIQNQAHREAETPLVDDRSTRCLHASPSLSRLLFRCVLQVLPGFVVAPLFFQGKIELGVVSASTRDGMYNLRDLEMPRTNGAHVGMEYPMVVNGYTGEVYLLRSLRWPADCSKSESEKAKKNNHSRM